MSDSAVSEQVSSSLKRFACPTIPNGKDWEAFRGIITYLYQECNQRLQDVINVMLHDFNFRATKRMYTQRFRQWNIAKNLRSDDVREYLQGRCSTGRASNDKDSVVLRGRMVPKEKLLKHLRRRKIAIETRFHDSEVSEESLGVSISSKRSICRSPVEEADRTYGRYNDLEDIVDMDEIEDGLTSGDLTSLHVAMLQTDFHYQQTSEDALAIHQARLKQRDHYPFATPSPSQLLTGTQELRDLEFVLHNSNVTYGLFPGAKYQPPPEAIHLSARQQTQAKDFYARHWLGVNLLSKFKAREHVIASFELLNQANEQIAPILQENHPHFLPWVAFVVCYPGKFEKSHKVQIQALRFAHDMSHKILHFNDPRTQIQRCLAKSKFRKSISLAMLRQIIAHFRQEIQQSHLEALNLLARLFDTVETYNNFDESIIEQTLHRWAESSLSIATVIKEDRKLARLKEERQVFDPVRVAASCKTDVWWE